MTSSDAGNSEAHDGRPYMKDRQTSPLVEFGIASSLRNKGREVGRQTDRPTDTEKETHSQPAAFDTLQIIGLYRKNVAGVGMVFRRTVSCLPLPQTASNELLVIIAHGCQCLSHCSSHFLFFKRVMDWCKKKTEVMGSSWTSASSPPTIIPDVLLTM